MQAVQINARDMVSAAFFRSARAILVGPHTTVPIASVHIIFLGTIHHTVSIKHIFMRSAREEVSVIKKLVSALATLDLQVTRAGD